MIYKNFDEAIDECINVSKSWKITTYLVYDIQLENWICGVLKPPTSKRFKIYNTYKP
jgi:hypothetical protein